MGARAISLFVATGRWSYENEHLCVHNEYLLLLSTVFRLVTKVTWRPHLPMLLLPWRVELPLPHTTCLEVTLSSATKYTELTWTPDRQISAACACHLEATTCTRK